MYPIADNLELQCEALQAYRFMAQGAGDQVESSTEFSGGGGGTLGFRVLGVVNLWEYIGIIWGVYYPKKAKGYLLYYWVWPSELPDAVWPKGV